MSKVVDLDIPRTAAERLARQVLKCPGVGRDKDRDSALQFYFNRHVTDDEMKFLHEVMQRTVALMPKFTGTVLTPFASPAPPLADQAAPRGEG
jgi:hypothetical protein